MKKLILIVALVLLVPATTVCKAFEDEILFRGIPWGSNYYYVESQVVSEGFSLGSISGNLVRTYSISEILYGLSANDDTLKDNINLSAYGIGVLPLVAGYKPRGINYYFAFTPKDEILTREKKDTSLYGGSYKYKMEDPESAFQDISQKLIEIYGDYDDSFERYIGDHIRLWNGANNTLLVIRWEDRKGISERDPNLYIHYVWKDGDALLRQANDTLGKMQLQLEEKMREAESTDGL